jgi:hypothetical protein
MFNNDKWPPAVQAAFKMASKIQISGAISTDMSFFQGLLARAQAGATVEWLLERPRILPQTGLTTAYFERLTQAGAVLFLVPEHTDAALLPFILLDHHTLLLPPDDMTTRAEMETRTDKIAPYRALYLRQRNKSTVSSSLSLPHWFDIRFETTPEFVDMHQRFELSWDVRGADDVRIEPLLGIVPPRGSRVLSAEQSTEFRLTAEKNGQSLTRVLCVTVNPTPKIEYKLTVAAEYEGQETPLRPHTNRPHQYGLVQGQAIRLHWRASDAHQVLLDGRPIPPNGNMILMPNSATVYTLVAEGRTETVQQTLFVDVSQRPEIGYLSVK